MIGEKRTFVCEVCQTEFSLKYRMTKKRSLRYCSKRCKSVDQRATFRNKTMLENRIREVIKEKGQYLTLDEVTRVLDISTKTLSKFRVSVLSLNRELGMKQPKRAFEHFVGEVLKKILPDIKHEMVFETCTSTKGFPLRFDFYSKEENLLIEADGVQHIDTKNPWYSKYYDECSQRKETWASDSGVQILRIPYTKRVTDEYVMKYVAPFIHAKATAATTQVETPNVKAKNAMDRPISNEAPKSFRIWRTLNDHPERE